MSVYFVVLLVRWLSFTVAVAAVLAKIGYTIHAKGKFANLPVRTITWFSHIEVHGTTSEFKRQYMKLSNTLTYIIILSAITSIAMFMVPINY